MPRLSQARALLDFGFPWQGIGTKLILLDICLDFFPNKVPISLLSLTL